MPSILKLGFPSSPNFTLPTVAGEVFARTFRLRVGKVARFSVSPLESGPMSRSVSALTSVKVMTDWATGAVPTVMETPEEVVCAPPLSVARAVRL